MQFFPLSVSLLLVVFMWNGSYAQTQQRWQQEAAYTMEINMDAEKHQYTGKQTLVYQNNSNDELNRAFYHLYFNAFQPGSMMDVRSNTILDPDPRVGDRISKLEEDEIGYQKISSLTQDGKAVKFEHVGTILEVELDHPIPAGGKSTFVMEWAAQVPLQVRRSGRDNKEGIDLSMTQWYPKMCEYDYMGWHANPYVGREFHGIWGTFDVKITIDKKYIIGGTGVLQNPEQIGYGYEKAGQTVKRAEGDQLTWHFKAENVHDFAWAADPDYKHVTAQVPDGPLLHFFYEDMEKTTAWKDLPELAVKAFQFIQEKYGKYPYPQYTVIQGGDGGMEYPMATLITGHRSERSLIGVTVHEALHMWFQMMMGTNEALYPWMDEGFTSYASGETMHHLFPSDNNPQASAYQRYMYLARAGEEEPLSTHADHYKTNAAYGIGSYGKGAVFVHQLGYVIGQDALDRGMLRYYDEWHFRHPNDNDFIRVMEKESGLELDWYKEYFVYSTKTIDYGIASVEPSRKETTINLQRIGLMPMPLDIEVELKDGSRQIYNIPLQIMRGAKPQQDQEASYTVLEDWPWTNPTYSFTLPIKGKEIVAVRIDPVSRMADLEKENNEYIKE